MRYRLIYSKNYLSLSLWSDDYRWIVKQAISFHKCGYEVEIWEYNKQGSRLLERNLHEN